MDFDFDREWMLVDRWKSMLENAGADPNRIYDLVGATRKEIECMVNVWVAQSKATRL